MGAGQRLLPLGVAAFGMVLAGWLIYAAKHVTMDTVDPSDLHVYVNGGLIVRHVSPPYDPTFQHPLYDWPASKIALKFTYTPFAALFFAAISVLPWSVLPRLSQVANLAFLLIAAWYTMGALDRRARLDRGRLDRGRLDRGRLDRVRFGGALLGAAAGLLTEPVFRTIYLGQINLLLMAVLIWDLSQPDDRGWKGLATGFAAGIKLVPLIFIPYLLLTRRFRAAAAALVGFAVTVIAGFAVIPGDSDAWWFHGLFLADGRTGFVGWGGNQGLRGLVTRIVGSIDGATMPWLVFAVVAAVIGLTCAVLFDRAGHTMLAILTTALVGLLDSPISWDHHWVWVVPGMMTATYYAVRAWQERRFRAAAACAALAAILLLIFAPWPGTLWGHKPTGPGDFTSGLIWAGPNSPVTKYSLFGDLPWFKEYHWHGLQNVSGNAYVLAGAALLVLLSVLASRMRRTT